MSRSLGRDEEETPKLDESFRKTLADIRPYVLSLTSVEDAKLCGMWLDKLSCTTTQRYLRNEYIVELCRQLRTGRVVGIFTEHPPNGPLQPLSITHEMTNNVTSPESERSGNVDAKHELRRPRKGRHIDEYERPIRIALPSSCRLDIEGSSTTTVQTNSSTIGLDPETDMEGQTLTPGAYLQRIDVLTAIIKALKSENNRLKRESRDCVDYYANSNKPDLRGVIEQLRGEVTTLKAELGETKRAKDALEENHRVFVQRYKSTMTEQLMQLKAKQEETEHENRALTVEVAKLSRKLEDVQAEVVVAEQKLSGKYDKLETRYEILPIEMENGSRKIDSMKKTICKLEKSKEKLVYNYEKRISRIIQSKELEIEALKLKLHGQKGQLAGSAISEKQCEVGNLMDTLEERYKAILAAADATAENQRQSYLKKIMFLEEQLTRLKKSHGGDGEGT